MEFAVTISLVCFAAFIICRTIRNRRIDSEHKCRAVGAKNGVFEIGIQERTAKIPYEVGSGVDFIIFDGHSKWLNGEKVGSSDRQQLIKVLESWGKARGKTIAFDCDT